MEDAGNIRSSDDEVGKEIQQLKEEEEDQRVLDFLDSILNYLTQLDYLSSTLRQGWLDIASARHSMGASRINVALFDLKFHSAATTLKITEQKGSVGNQPSFTLHKWASTDEVKCCTEEGKYTEDDLKKSNSLQLRHRGRFVETQDASLPSEGVLPAADNQVQKERVKSLSMFGTLVSPKLRAAQLSFEAALEMLVEIANIQSSMRQAYDQLRNNTGCSEDLN